MEAINFHAQTQHSLSHSDEASEGRLILPHFPLQLDKPDSMHREAVEQFIARRFKTVYNAEVTHFLPYLLSTHTDTRVCAALGFQPATTSSYLFLENYLPGPIESILSFQARMNVRREKIVELGNLASERQRATQTLFVLIADILQRSGYEWVVFTANSAVRSWMEKLNLRCIAMCEADPAALPDAGASWGSYYADKPVVLACHLEPGFEANKRNRLIQFLRQSYSGRIAEFIEELNQ